MLHLAIDFDHGKCFCSTCGSALHLCVELEGGWLVKCPPGVDSDVTLKPDAHLRVATEAATGTVDSSPVIEGAP